MLGITQLSLQRYNFLVHLVKLFILTIRRNLLSCLLLDERLFQEGAKFDSGAALKSLSTELINQASSIISLDPLSISVIRSVSQEDRVKLRLEEARSVC